MMAVDIGFDPALNFGTSGAPADAGCALSGSACGATAARAATKAAGGRQGAFHGFLRDAAQPASPAGREAAAPEGDPISAHAATECRQVETGCRPTKIAHGVDSAWEALAQLVQSLIQASGKAAEPSEAPSPEGGPGTDTGEEGEGFLRFIDLLRQLQAPRSASAAESDSPLSQLRELLAQAPAGPESGEKPRGIDALLDQLRASRDERPAESGATLSQLRELLARVQAEGERQGANGLPGRVHLLLAQAHETLPGIPWGRLAQWITGQGAPASVSAQTPPSGQSGSNPEQDASMAADGSPDIPDLVRTTRRQDNAPLAEKLGTTARPEASPPPVSERGAAAPNSSERPVAEAAAHPDRHGVSDRSATNPTREAPAAQERGAARAPEMPLPVDGLRRPDVEPSAPPTIGVEDGSDDGASAALLRDARVAPAPEAAADKTAAAGAALRPRDSGGPATRGDVVEQIVQRAAVHFKNDQGEARIDLKPEFMGQVRMQVVTDNQQVTVRIVTELPMVRDLIEQNLHQLKSDLQQQGLQVERVEVSVADDPRRDAGRQAWADRRPNGRGPDGSGDPSVGAVEQRAEEMAAYWSPGGRTTINMFV